MKITIETEGATIDEAVADACRQLRATPDDVHVEVVQEPKTTLGMTTRKARVRVTKGAPPEASTPANAEPVADENGTIESPVEESAPFEDDGDDESSTRHVVIDPNYDPAEELAELCRHLDPDVAVEARRETDRLVLSVASNGSGLFIGRHGETLDALQYLINRITARRNPKIGRIVVDSENYRDRKAARLEDDALALAQKVKKNGRPQMTRPLTAFDRRIVHTTLRDDELVTTRSIGDGDRKRVQVLLKSDARDGDRKGL
ncbi:MAG: Jag N-terminal domain-containing protein [Deltaproteobacteria bacterium]|nr:Jag N-terminal domain-containing protein [Deltaproteobacteria bacterium]